MARRAAPALGALLAYAACVPWIFRPWFLSADLLPHWPPPVGALIDADLNLNIWILGWIAHATLVDPTSLFDGNIYHPAPNTIVGSENMLAHVPITAPVLALTGNVLTMLKAYLVETFALSGLGMFVYVWHHTRNAWAAFVAGAAFTFTPFRAETVPQPQYLGLAFVPLALVSVDLYLEDRRGRWLFCFGASLVLQALSCVYVGFFIFALTPVYVLVRAIQRSPSRRGWIAPTTALAATMVASAVVLLPAALPYLGGRSDGSIPDYDLAYIQIAGWAPWRYLSGEFVWRAGIVAVLLFAVDLAARAWQRWAAATGAAPRGGAPTVALWAMIGCAAVLAIGPYLVLPGGVRIPMPYVALYEIVPGFSSIRVPTRFVIIVSAGLAALGGFTFDRLLSRTRYAPLAAGALFVLALVGTTPEPRPVMAANLHGPPAAPYHWLADQPGPGAVLEIPAQTSEMDAIENLRNSRYMVASSLHWRPLLNGYTAYPPSSAGFFAAAIRELPSREALQLLVDTTDLRWILLHRGALTDAEAARWPRRPPGLDLVARFGETEVFTPTLARSRDWRDSILAHAGGESTTSLEGAPLQPLPEECRRGAIVDADLPSEIGPIPLPRFARVRIRNDSDCVWPATGVLGRNVVGVDYRWLPPEGHVDDLLVPVPLFQLLADVPPRSEADGAVMVTPPRGPPGEWTIELRLRQEGSREPIATRRAPVVFRQAGTPRKSRQR